MQYDPVARAAFSEMSMVRIRHSGQPDVPDHIFSTLSNITQRVIDSKFREDIGFDVKSIKFHLSAVELKTTQVPGSLNFPINKLFPRLETITLSSIDKFIWRDGTVFLKLKMPSGIEQLVFNPLPFKLPSARIFLNPETGSVDLEFGLFGTPKQIKFYLCYGELDTFRCAHCGKCGDVMSKCGRCITKEHCVRYCTKECQNAHWSIHKRYCSK
jgi:hypothetical protein